MSDLGDVPGLTPAYYSYIEGFNRAGFAAFALFAYDTLITFDDEIRYVWRSQWSIPKCLFLGSRYFALVGVGVSFFLTTGSVSASFCSIFSAVDFLWVLIIGFTCDGLLLMRVIALYNGRRWLCRVLYFLFGLVYLVEAVITGYFFYFQIHNSVTGVLLDCSSTTTTAEQGLVVAMATLPVLLFNALLFTLTLVHLFPYWRARGPSGTDLLSLFLKQGTVYFAIAFVAFFLETVMSLERLTPTLSPWLVLVPIASNRLFLSLRKQAGTSLPEDETVRGPWTSQHVVNLRDSDDSEEYVLHGIRREREGWP